MTIRRFSELHDYRVAPGSYDIRGWHVLDREGQKAGIVEDLVVDTVEGHVRDALIHIEGHDHRVPVGPLDLDPKEQQVTLPCTLAELLALPIAPEFHSRERQLLRTTFFPQLAGEEILGEFGREKVAKTNPTSKEVGHDGLR